MESKNNFKRIDIENHSCYYLQRYFIRQKKYENILICDIS